MVSPVQTANWSSFAQISTSQFRETDSGAKFSLFSPNEEMHRFVARLLFNIAIDNSVCIRRINSASPAVRNVFSCEPLSALLRPVGPIGSTQLSRQGHSMSESECGVSLAKMVKLLDSKRPSVFGAELRAMVGGEGHGGRYSRIDCSLVTRSSSDSTQRTEDCKRITIVNRLAANATSSTSRDFEPSH
jgi:hypothetical protein